MVDRAGLSLPSSYQNNLAPAIMQTVIEACDAYFCRHEQTYLGDSRAPEFTDEQITQQFEYFDGYRADSGAMGYGDNKKKPYAYDLTALPAAWKRAICERIWVLCQEAGLWEDAAYMQDVQRRRLQAEHDFGTG